MIVRVEQVMTLLVLKRNVVVHHHLMLKGIFNIRTTYLKIHIKKPNFKSRLKPQHWTEVLLWTQKKFSQIT